jgi:multidrug efflux pump subunit AcrA (membrane-fusion protein)
LLASSPSFGQPQAPIVTVERAESADVRATVNLVGSIHPRRRSRLASEEPGIVEKLEARRGDLVQKGQLICSLNPDILQEELNEAKHRLEALTQAHEELRAGTRKEEVDRLEGVLKESEAIKTKWDFERTRVQRLFDQGNAGEKEYHDVLAEQAAAESRLAQANADLTQAINGPRKELIAQARAETAAAKAAVARLTRRIEKTNIFAPFEGFVVDLSTEVGEWVERGGTIVEIVDIYDVRAVVNLPEKYVSGVERDQDAIIEIEGLGEELNGKIWRVIPQASPSARTFPVQIKLENADYRIKAGMSVNGRFAAGPLTKVLLIPKDSLVQRGRLRQVFVVRGGAEGKMAHPVTVQPGAPVGTRISVKSDEINDGDLVVVRGNERLMPMAPSPVEIVGELNAKSHKLENAAGNPQRP